MIWWRTWFSETVVVCRYLLFWRERRRLEERVVMRLSWTHFTFKRVVSARKRKAWRSSRRWLACGSSSTVFSRWFHSSFLSSSSSGVQRFFCACSFHYFCVSAQLHKWLVGWFSLCLLARTNLISSSGGLLCGLVWLGLGWELVPLLSAVADFVLLLSRTNEKTAKDNNLAASHARVTHQHARWRRHAAAKLRREHLRRLRR